MDRPARTTACLMPRLPAHPCAPARAPARAHTRGSITQVFLTGVALATLAGNALAQSTDARTGARTNASAEASATCSARSAAQAPVVVELYTSEGCSSCPPADRWLSTLKGRPGVLALNFHVTYWDRLGWPDRFASADYTQRQYDWAARHGSRQVYTPQVIVNGVDWKRWPALPGPAADQAAAPVKVQLTRQGGQVLAEVSAAASGTAALSAYWAVLEDGHFNQVRAGENRGETLHHDHVVRQLRPVDSWAAAEGLRTPLAVGPGEARTPRRVAFVVVDAKTHRPLQAAVLPC